jgi:predicted CoA-binding protein
LTLSAIGTNPFLESVIRTLAVLAAKVKDKRNAWWAKTALEDAGYVISP